MEKNYQSCTWIRKILCSSLHILCKFRYIH